MDDEAGDEVVKALGESARFFNCNVLETESVAKAVQGTVDWVNQTGKTLGGVIPAAGVSTPATVSSSFSFDIMSYIDKDPDPRP